MLIQLEINNVALINRVSIELGEGLNILTGETGAGKSIIIDSISAVLGARLPRDLIRTGCDKALVEAVFRTSSGALSDLLESMGFFPESDGTLIISREFTASGKNTCRVNGKLATVTMLKEIGEKLIDIHGQFDNQSLLRTETHVELLDSFGGRVLQNLKLRYRSILEEYAALKARLREISGDRGERERKIDLLRYQVDEINKARLKKGEEEELNRQRLVLSNSEKIAGALTEAYEMLYSSGGSKSPASDLIGGALSSLGSISRLDEKYGSLLDRLQDISYQLEDIIHDIREEKDGTEFNPGLLEEVEERLDLIYKLKRKYGSTIEGVLEYGKKTAGQLEDILKSEELANELGKQLAETEARLFEIAAAMNRERLKAAELLEARIGAELEELEMKRARFKAVIDFDEAADENGARKYDRNGLDRVEFLISPNAGEPIKPLAKIASGGEMSRIMLAIKTILADADEIPTLIFDEIDIGVSGRAAQKVGEKLSIISKQHQVLCVTHLAQIASMADNHYLIEKITDGDKTNTYVNKLDAAHAKNEIARILGGTNITEITKRHAEEILQNAHAYKAHM